MSAAAIFDLDRTLLRGASGPVLGKALQAVDLMSDRHIPGQDLLFSVFNAIGENLPSMLLTRQSARMTAGWDVKRLRKAGKLAAPDLDALVQPYARVLIDEHLAAGRHVVLATTSPYELVAPLADRLGMDVVLATRYEIRDGLCTGRIDGRFVWGRDKIAEVREWAAAHDVDLAESYAYSDSWYDQHLLAGVGHPVAVNPDPRLQAMALVRRWPVQYLDVPPQVPKFVGIEPQKVLMNLFRPELTAYANVHVRGVEHLPESGPAILVANHRSYFDPLALGFAINKRGRPVRFLGKKEVFDAPLVGDLARAMGGIRVERGSGSDEPLKEAAAAVAAGELVAIMPQGTIPRGADFFDPVLKGKWGAAKLAAETGAPVIPIGLWGTEKVWPRNAKVPNLLPTPSRPDVWIRVGPPVELALQDPEADTVAIMAAIVDQLPDEARQAHVPTEDEIAATMPSNIDPDAPTR